MNKRVGLKNVKINSGFWQERQEINAKTTIYAVWEQLKKNRRFEALKLQPWKEKDGLLKPHIFWDSDVAKWIEAVAFTLEHQKDEKLEALADEYIDLMAQNQQEDGYFNSYFLVFEPENRWTRRGDHELYCAGHLIESAVAYYNATGKDKFLKFVCKFADHIEQVFIKEKSAEFLTPGHEEIELALVKLYSVTGEKRYLELGKHFIDMRGVNEPCLVNYPNTNGGYAQDHLPVREQKTAEGHAVRAMYLYSAMADYADIYGDAELLSACKTLFSDTVNKKMYITGGIGSSYLSEAFTAPYDLPNTTAYAESCASIGLIFFASRLALHENSSIYADVIERALYNGVLANISLDGKSFYYENALEVDPKLINRDVCSLVKTHYPLIERQEYFECSCCPPNNARLFAALGEYIYTKNNDTLFVHQYMGNSAKIEVEGKVCAVTQTTDYPFSGDVKISIQGLKGKKIALRIPEWCEEYSIVLDGVVSNDFEVIDGYAYINIMAESAEIELKLTLDAFLVEATPNVQENSGRVALMRGPLVYCLEGVDNGENLRDCVIDKDLKNCEIDFDNALNAATITVDGYRRDEKSFNALYERANNDRYQKTRLKFIPYYCHANRGITEMIIWILR